MQEIFIFHTNFEFIFAMRDSKLTRRGLEHTPNTAQNKGQDFTFSQELVFSPCWADFIGNI